MLLVQNVPSVSLAWVGLLTSSLAKSGEVFTLWGMSYDFDRIIERRFTGSEKWQPVEKLDVLPMPVADMDFASPPELCRALQEKVEHGVFGYAQPTKSLFETMVGMCADRYGWAIDPEWIVWLPGLVSGLNVTCRAVGEPGDAVLTMTPVYPPFLTSPGQMKREVQKVPMRESAEGWSIDWEAMEKAVTSRTKLLLLCQPHNPMGLVFGQEELAAIRDFCLRHDLILCSDEIHCDLILDDRRHVPTAAMFPELAERSITLMAPSKTYNVAGLGCALAIIPDRALRHRFVEAKKGIVPQVTVFGYAACEAAYRYGEPWRKELLAYLRGNRDLITEALVGPLAPLRGYPIEATYLAWIDARPLGLKNPAQWFYDHGIQLSDGRFFDGPGFVRLNFGCPRSVLREGLKRMAAAVAAAREQIASQDTVS